MNIADEGAVLKILAQEKLAYIATTDGSIVDNAVVCFASDRFEILFGCYEDTLKGRYIEGHAQVALAIGALQIHGIARKLEYKSSEYEEKLRVYGKKWGEFLKVFDKENNQLYAIRPLVIWHYNPKRGEMNRDLLIFDDAYYAAIRPYEARSEYRMKGRPPSA